MGVCDYSLADFQDFPGLDSLHKYDVSVDDGGQVRVRAKKSLADGESTLTQRYYLLFVENE